MEPRLKPTEFEAFGGVISESEFLRKTEAKVRKKNTEKKKRNDIKKELCGKVKLFAKVESRKKQVLIKQDKLDELIYEQKSLLLELIEKFGFNIQYVFE